jgi:CDP-diglyceride synthetase
MEENKRQYLEFIQNIITRMNSNSFMIKGWTITIVSALLVLFATIKVDSLYIITILPIILFWVLDAYYLQLERKFRSLYNNVIQNHVSVVLYSMNIEEPSIKNNHKNKYWNLITSKTIWPFYVFLIIITGSLCGYFVSKKEEVKKETITLSILDTIKVKTIDTIKNEQKQSILKPLALKKSNNLKTKK